jgi:hypothetical protein
VNGEAAIHQFICSNNKVDYGEWWTGMTAVAHESLRHSSPFSLTTVSSARAFRSRAITPHNGAGDRLGDSRCGHDIMDACVYWDDIIYVDVQAYNEMLDSVDRTLSVPVHRGLAPSP